MLFLANQGVEILRLDAVAFVWKRLGTTCESLPEAHLLVRAFNALGRIAAPALLFKSEAIVHPDEVASYIAPGECQLSYNPLQMALVWDTLATRDARLLQQALQRGTRCRPGCAWVNYVRSHDDIGWTFDDDDAARARHQRLRPPPLPQRLLHRPLPRVSFARGVPFQENPRTGDCRISGTTASLAGLGGAATPGASRRASCWRTASPCRPAASRSSTSATRSGQLNDYGYVDDPATPATAAGSTGRATRQPTTRNASTPPPTPAGCTDALRHLIDVRRRTPELAGNTLVPFDTKNPHLVSYQRPGHAGGRPTVVLVVANVGRRRRE